MSFGLGLLTASGVAHEVDIVAQAEPVLGVLELKHRSQWVPEKNDIIVFFAKILDYLCLTPSLLKGRIVPVFISTYGFEQSGLAACLGLGIHPVAPYIRPVPVLIDNAMRMLAERTKGLKLPDKEEIALDDFCSMVSRLSNDLAGAEVNNRFGYLNDSSFEVSAFGGMQVHEMVSELRSLNYESTRFLDVIKAAKGARI